MKLLILSLVFVATAASRTAPDVAERVAQESRENIQIHDGFLAEEKKDVVKEKQVKANKDLSALQRDTPKATTTPKEPSDKKISEMQAHLEQVLTGLQSVAAAQKEKTKFSEILQPFMKEMSTVLTKVKTDTKLSKQQKWEMLQNTQKGVSGLAKDMSKRQEELTEESESEKESLLIGVLMAKAHRDEAEQMAVLKSDEFKNLSVVKEVLAHREAGKSLAEQVAASLDKKSGAKPGTSAKFLSKGNSTKTVDTIVAKLQSSVDKMDKRMKLAEKVHKEHMAKLAEVVKKDEAKARSSNGTKAEIETKVHRIEAGEKRMMKKAEREFQKMNALSNNDAKSLREAISAIKKGDMSALAKARKALTDSLNRIQSSSGEFLHFLQVSAYTNSRDGACPYCKAQCLEKCHSGGASFVTCMGQCADVGN